MILFATCAACAATQSAHTLPPGKVDLGVSIGRSSRFEKDVDEGSWSGRASVRVGVVDGFDVGAHFEHTPGTATIGSFAIDMKVRLARSGRSTVAFGVPAGIVWEDVADNFEFSGGFVMPSLYLSVDLSPTVELVSNVRYVVARETGSFRTLTGFGASIGPRFVDETRTWAVQPEVGMLRHEEETLLTFGLTLTVGN
ncbi:MAG: hypothetical protein ACKV2T_23125 [Kofleriaceae bacterium]